MRPKRGGVVHPFGCAIRRTELFRYSIFFRLSENTLLLDWGCFPGRPLKCVVDDHTKMQVYASTCASLCFTECCATDRIKKKTARKRVHVILHTVRRRIVCSETTCRRHRCHCHRVFSTYDLKYVLVAPRVRDNHYFCLPHAPCETNVEPLS